MPDARDGGGALGCGNPLRGGGARLDLHRDVSNAGQGAQRGLAGGLDRLGDRGVGRADLQCHRHVAAGDLDALQKAKRDNVPAKTGVANLGECGADLVFVQCRHDETRKNTPKKHSGQP